MVNARLWIGTVLAILLSMPIATAFGVSSPHWTDNPLVLEPGQSRDVTLSLQNMVGDQDIIVKAKIISGEDYADLNTGETYAVDFGQRHVPVELIITIPDSAELGTELKVQISFTEVKEGDSGFVGISSAVATTIPVVIGSEHSPVPDIQYPTDGASNFYNYLLIGLVLLALILAVGYLSRKR